MGTGIHRSAEEKHNSVGKITYQTTLGITVFQTIPLGNKIHSADTSAGGYNGPSNSVGIIDLQTQLGTANFQTSWGYNPLLGLLGIEGTIHRRLCRGEK